MGSHEYGMVVVALSIRRKIRLYISRDTKLNISFTVTHIIDKYDPITLHQKTITAIVLRIVQFVRNNSVLAVYAVVDTA